MPDILRDINNMPTDLQIVWEEMQAMKQDIVTRCEQYAMWTIPSVCPIENEGGQEQSKGNVAIGAKLVNNLSNRIVDTMFPSDRPFFSLPLTPAAKRQIVEDHEGDETAAAKQALMIRKVTEDIVQDAMREFDLTQYRPIAVETVKHSIVTGGCMVRRHLDGLRSVYGIKDYCAARDMRGVLVKVILRDVKLFKSLAFEDQRVLEERFPGKYKGDSEVVIYTYFERVSKTSWKGVQGLDKVVLNQSYDTYNSVNLPVLDITWNLSRGEDYPRGLVEDHANLFHNVDVTTEAILDLIGIAADVKYFVDPASGIDIDELNNSLRGSYHSGRADDVTALEFKHRLDLQVMAEQVQAWERLLSQSFLMSSGSVRDAERVTAEEIRAFARELESAFGGLYSKLALSWQKREADYLMAEQVNLEDYEGLPEFFDVVVTTGLESLSREGQLEALRLAIADLQMLDAVPEDIRATLDKRAFTEFVFVNRGINFAQFVLSQDQIDANRERELQEQQRLMQTQGAVDTATNVASRQGE